MKKPMAAVLAIAGLAMMLNSQAEDFVEPHELARLCTEGEPYTLDLVVSMEGSTGGDASPAYRVRQTMATYLIAAGFTIEAGHSQALKVAAVVTPLQKGASGEVADWLYLLQVSFEVPLHRRFGNGGSRRGRAKVWDRVTYGNTGNGEHSRLGNRVSAAAREYAEAFAEEYLRVNRHAECAALRGE